MSILKSEYLDNNHLESLVLWSFASAQLPNMCLASQNLRFDQNAPHCCPMYQAHSLANQWKIRETNSHPDTLVLPPPTVNPHPNAPLEFELPLKIERKKSKKLLKLSFRTPVSTWERVTASFLIVQPKRYKYVFYSNSLSAVEYRTSMAALHTPVIDFNASSF